MGRSVLLVVGAAGFLVLGGCYEGTVGEPDGDPGATNGETTDEGTGDPEPIPAGSGTDGATGGDDTSEVTDTDTAADGSSSGEADESGSTGDPWAGGLSFQEVLPLLLDRCGAAGCHQQGFEAAGLNLDPEGCYDKVMGFQTLQIEGMSLVERGDPEASYFYLKLTGTHAGAGGLGSQMPVGGPYYTEEELAVFAQWIEEGANP